MKNIADKSIDMILCDLPYGTTACKWDSIIPFDLLWEQYERIIKDNGAIVLTATQPFTSDLVLSNLKMFRYEWIWEKTLHTNFFHIKKQPAKKHENILVFYKKKPVYNPQMEVGKPYTDKRNKKDRLENYYNRVTQKKEIVNDGKRYPGTVQKFSNGNNKSMHPTQKPVALFEYLIKTYTNEGQTILDNCAGSGTTAIAAINTGRNYILIEKEQEYIEAINNRIAKHVKKMELMGNE
jgi:site-specific DNA-methyltransferase (adenine-specific)